MDDKKPVLPFGWMVKQSKTYPDRIYYFNINTGASSWGFPDLLQHYVSGETDRTVTPVLSATSIKVDTVSSEKSPIPTTSTKQKSQQPDKHKNSTSSHNKSRDSRSSYDNTYKKLSTGQVLQNLEENPSRKTMKPHTLSQLKCSQRVPIVNNDSCNKKEKQLKSSAPENRFSDRVKSPHQPYPISNVKKGRTYAETSVASRKNEVQSGKKEGTSQTGQRHKLACTDTGKSVQQNIKNSSQTTVKSNQSCTSKSNEAKPASNVGSKTKKSAKISPVKLPKEIPGKAKSTCSNKSSGVQRNDEYSSSVNKGSRNALNIGKNETTNKTNAKRTLEQDSQPSLKRQKTETEVQCPHMDKMDKKEVPSEKRKSKRKKKKQSKVKYEESSHDTYKHVAEDKKLTEDKRKVVRSGQPRYNVTNNATSKITKTLTVTQSNYDTNVNKSVLPMPHYEKDPASGIGTDFDRNNNSEYKLFIGDKDKLLSIQSWINNIQDRAGSESPSVESHSQASLSHVNESVDSGYLTNTTLKTCSPPETGWPVELKETNATCMQAQDVDDMDIDEYDLGKFLGFNTESKFKSGKGILQSGERVLQSSEGAGGEVRSGDDEELMDIDEVLVEVRQQVSGSGVQNAGSFLTYTDDFTPVKATNQIVTVVVDTNVLISNLGLFEMLKDYQLQGRGQAKLCLYIPWIVLRELDFLKEKMSEDRLCKSQIQTKARAASSVLKNLFSRKHPRVKGQTPKEADEASCNFKSSCNDDDILQACLQCRNKGLSVVLLTNDNNLIVKALVSKISAFSAKDIVAGLNEADAHVQVETCVNPTNVNQEMVRHVKHEMPATSKRETCPDSKCAVSIDNKACISRGKPVVSVGHDVIPLSNKPEQSCFADTILKEEKTSSIETLVDDMYCKMKTVLHEALGKILELEMQKAYDDIWTDIIYRKPPWDLRAILECWKKHWIAVFGIVFPRYMSQNVDNLLSNITTSNIKGASVEVVKHICEDGSEILEKAVSINMYSARISEISKTVRMLRDLCEKIPSMTAASVPNLEQYLNSQGNTIMHDAARSRLTNPNSALHVSQCTSAITVINTPQTPSVNQSSNIRPHTQSSLHDGNHGNQKSLQSGSLQNVSSLNLQTGSQGNIAVSSAGCDTTVTDCDTSSELMAGEYLSHIWRCIYTHCDEFYRTISTTSDQGVLKSIEPILKVLVSICLEMRKYYAGLLELPVSDLTNREGDFTVLSQICNSFFAKLNVQENIPGGSVTPLQLLVLYSKPVYRETLMQFLSKLDEMLKMMYQCLHKLCPDD